MSRALTRRDLLKGAAGTAAALFLAACASPAAAPAPTSAPASAPTKPANTPAPQATTPAAATSAPLAKSGYSGAGQETLVLKGGSESAVNDYDSKALARFAELMKERTNGKLQITHYPASQLGNARQMIEAVTLGSLAYVTSGLTGNPAYDSLFLPYMWKSDNHIAKVLNGPIGEKWSQDSIKEKGIRTFGHIYRTPRQSTFSKKEVHVVGDVKGLKFRVPEIPISVATWKAMGANPTPMAWSEVYTALQQGTIDGQENPLSTIMANSLWEVQKYLVLTSHAQSAFIAQINEGIWQKMTPETQKVWMDTWKEVMDQAQADVKAADQALIAQWKSHGQVVIEPDLTSFKEATKDVWKEYAPKAWGEGVYEQIQALE